MDAFPFRHEVNILRTGFIILTCAFLMAACGGEGNSGSDEENASANKVLETAPHTVALYAEPENAGTYSGGGQYKDGQKVSLTAQTTPHYVFVNWTDGNGHVLSERPDFELTVDHDYALQANFELARTAYPVGTPPAGVITELRAAGEPGLLFASTAEKTTGDQLNGLWRSRDWGASWERLATGKVPFISVGSGDPDLVIVGVEEFFVISMDAGENWTTGGVRDASGNLVAFNDGAAFTAEWGVYMVSSATSGAGIYLLNPFDRTSYLLLSETDTGVVEKAQFQHIEVSPSNPNIIYASTATNNEFVKSFDGGWSYYSLIDGLAPTGGTIGDGIAVNPLNSNQLFVDGSLSVDGGVNWIPNSQVTLDRTFWVDDYVVRFNEIDSVGILEVSRDFGASWTDVLTLDDGSGTGFNTVSIFSVGRNQVYFEAIPNGSSTAGIYGIDFSLIRSGIESL